MNKEQIIMDELDNLFPNPKCELNYDKDYELLLAVMLSAQTTDKRVNLVTAPLFKKYSSLESLDKLSEKEIASEIKSIGMYRQKAKHFKNIVSELIKIGGYVPNDREILIKMSGVGRKTINVVLSNLYNEPCIAVDTHVSRVSKRLSLSKEDDDVLDIEKKLMKKFPKDKWSKLHHQMVLFGRYKCTARNPECRECNLKHICKYYKENNQ